MAKKRGPYVHTGKVIKLRTREEIEIAASENIGDYPSLDWYRETIEYLYAAEELLFENNRGSDSVVYDQRIAAVDECRAWLNLVERESLKPQDSIGARYLANNALQLGFKIAICKFRLLENSAVDGMNQYDRAMRRV